MTEQEKRENRFFTILFISASLVMPVGIITYNIVNYVKQQKAIKKQDEKKEQKRNNKNKDLSFAKEYKEILLTKTNTKQK